MRKLSLIIIALIVCLSVTALAQTGSTASKPNGEFGYGYVFFGPGGYNSGGSEATMQVGGGGEAVFKNGAGIGAELAYLTRFKDTSDGIGMFSINGSYHFLKASKSGKVVPFLTGGYTGFMKGDYVNGINVGGGVNYWFKPRVGLRFEFRNSVWLEDSVWSFADGMNFFNARIGLTFR